MRVDPRSCTLLKGLVGSTAYGLDHADSDKDYIGMFAVPTVHLLGLDASNLDTAIEFKNPDTKFYEAGHYVRLALKSNPSILELLWLENYSTRTSFGDKLIKIRDAFPSRKLVKAAYLGYATQQHEKLMKDDREEKRAKNARHFVRLLRQGAELYSTGQLVVRLPDPDEVRNLGLAIAQGNLDVARLEMTKAEKKFNSKSALPESANTKLVNEWLLGVRHELYRHSNSNLDQDLGKPKGRVGGGR